MTSTISSDNTTARTTIMCECGCELTPPCMPKHKKSTKHQMLLAGATLDEFHFYHGEKTFLTFGKKAKARGGTTQQLDDNMEKRKQYFRDMVVKYGLIDPWIKNNIPST